MNRTWCHFHRIHHPEGQTGIWWDTCKYIIVRIRKAMRAWRYSFPPPMVFHVDTLRGVAPYTWRWNKKMWYKMLHMWKLALFFSLSLSLLEATYLQGLSQLEALPFCLQTVWRLCKVGHCLVDYCAPGWSASRCFLPSHNETASSEVLVSYVLREWFVFPRKHKSRWFTCHVLNPYCVMPGLRFIYAGNSFSGLCMTCSYILYRLPSFIHITGERKMFIWHTVRRMWKSYILLQKKAMQVDSLAAYCYLMIKWISVLPTLIRWV